MQGGEGEGTRLPTRPHFKISPRTDIGPNVKLSWITWFFTLLSLALRLTSIVFLGLCGHFLYFDRLSHFLKETVFVMSCEWS